MSTAPETQPKSIYLVACCARKLQRPAPAQDLYTSVWFRLARAYVESQGAGLGVTAGWAILSAKYGWVLPTQVIESYDFSLRDMPLRDQWVWALRLAPQLASHITDGGYQRVVFLAGELYRDPVEHYLRRCCRGDLAFESPLKGLGIGQQLAWLKRQVGV